MELEKSSIPYGIKIKPLYNKISKEMRFICLDYQIFIIRTYAKELDSFYTTSFAILQNKEQETYKILFEKLKKKNANICNNNTIIEPKNLHYKLNELEHLSYYDYQRKIRGIWKIKKKSNK
ncbi:hypothetical protein H8356DRAFT_1291148 [Neocallimastix lanati (nom. inval.)]|nr:hypothetical protein H8356DRAFT_1291148 [Neocallimastix sp. JGI-2020a]